MPVGSNVDLGDSLLIPGLSAGSLNADLVPAMDVRNYRWLNLSIGATAYAGSLEFQASFDGTFTDTVDVLLYNLATLKSTKAFAVIFNDYPDLYGGPIRFPYFRVRMTTYSSGTATATLELRRDGLAGLQLVNSQVVDANDGTLSTVIAAGHAADTVILAQLGRLCSALVTVTGTNKMEFYDNVSTGSGTLVGLIPANPTVTGVPYVWKAPCANGITIKGNANNPGVTVFYTDVI
jgi:hypothetical protein